MKFGLHMKRTGVQFRASSGGLGEPSQAKNLNDGRLILNEITPKGLTIFCTSSVRVGQEIALTIEHPTRFYTKARIVSCAECQISYSVFQKGAFKYRVGIEFVVSGEEQKREISNYYKIVQKEVGRAA